MIYLGLRDELCDLLAGVERGHFHVGHTPVGSTLCVQNLVMFLQDLPESGEVQILEEDFDDFDDLLIDKFRFASIIKSRK